MLMPDAMKSFPLSLLFCIAPCVQAAVMPPSSAAGYTISVDLYQAQQCSSEIYQNPTGYWFDMPRTPLRLEFPVAGSNQYTAPHPHNNLHNTWPDIKVSYSPNADRGEAYVKVENPSFNALLVMTFTDSAGGTARIYLHEDGQTHHMRHVTFRMEKQATPFEPVTLPSHDECEGDPQMLDDGMFDIIAELETLRCTSPVEQLYRKRLLMLLSLIQMSGNPNETTPETKGNTALHYACGMGHVPLVQWLVKHGANTRAVTHKGATVDDCVSGKNEQTIRRILQQARQTPYQATPEQIAAKAGKWLEQAFACKDITAATADIPRVDSEAQQAAETLFRYAKAYNKHPFGVHVLSRMGRMLTWANNAKLTEKEFVDTIVSELYEARTYKKTEISTP